MDPEDGAEEHDLLLAAGSSRGALYALVGESIAKVMTDAVAKRTQLELSAFDHLVATGRADPDPPAQPTQHWVNVATETLAKFKEIWGQTLHKPGPTPPPVECKSRAGGYGTLPPREPAYNGLPTTQNEKEQSQPGDGTSTAKPLPTKNMCSSTRYWRRLTGTMTIKRGTSRWLEPQRCSLISMPPPPGGLPKSRPLEGLAPRTSLPPC